MFRTCSKTYTEMQLILSKGNESRVKNNQARLKLLCRDAAMSSSVSPRQRDIGGSGSTEPKGLTVSRKPAFPQVWQNSDVDAYRTPPFSSKTPPLSALYARQRRTLRVCQFYRPLNHRPLQFVLFSETHLASFRDNANCVFIGKILPIETKKRTFTSHNKTFAT